MASTSRHLVVDGSNIATEGRSLPSLAQLDEAVRAVLAEEPGRQITVIVDATFAHRIDASERAAFEDAVNAGEVITPPAGTVGRGDAFILQVAEKADAAVLSNDSFQEFHGEHTWLFDDDRLVGGKPVDGVGWIFMPRVPVRGPASRRATRSARGDRGDRTTKSGSRSSRGRSKSKSKSKAKTSSEASGPPPKPSAATPPPRRKSASKQPAKKKSSGSKKLQELNSPHDFMVFVTQHSIGDEVTAVVERFSSHGCYLRASSAQCYLPSSAMGDPPPTRARDVVALGQEVIARVESIDADRRGINVVLVRTVTDGDARKPAAGSPRGAKQGNTSQQTTSVADKSVREGNLTRSETNVATKKAAKKRPAKKTAKKAAKKAPVKKAAKATSSSRATKAAARRKATKKSTAKKATAKKRPAKKTAKKATKKATAKKRPAKKAAKKTTKKATAKKRPAKKATRR